MSTFVSFVVGFFASLCATCAAYFVALAIRRRKGKSLEGFWVEEMPRSERPVSVTALRYHGLTGRYIFEGWNYYPTGKVYCQFESDSVVLDWKSRKMFYIYRYWLSDSPEKQTYGFGWTAIEEGEIGPTFTEGHYRSSDPESVSRHAVMTRLSDACRACSMPMPAHVSRGWREDFVRAYVSHKDEGQQ